MSKHTDAKLLRDHHLHGLFNLITKEEEDAYFQDKEIDHVALEREWTRLAHEADKNLNDADSGS